MPQHRPPHDHPRPPNTLPTPTAELNRGNGDVVTASAVATALRAASANPAANPKSSLSIPSSHTKTNSLSAASRPPRTSSLLPPPRALQKSPLQGSEPAESAETAPAADRYWHPHTTGAVHGDPPELNTSPDPDDPWNAHRQKHNHLHQRSAQTPYDRIESAYAQGSLTLSQPTATNFPTRATESDLHAHRADHESQSTAGALPFVPLPPLELLPPLDKNLGEPELTSLADKPHTGSLPPEPSTHNSMPEDLPRDVQPSRGHGRRRSSKGSNDADKGKAAKPPSQKAMLSRALQKANTAVQLDNAQNLEGARIAYSEACELLQQVLRRTSGDEDKRKLEAIVSTRHTCG